MNVKRTIRILSVLLVVTMALTLAACRTERKEGTIRLNEVTHSIFYAPQYLAMALGYYEEAGITIELINGGGADKSMTALLSGEADVALMGPEATIYTYLQGKEDHPVVFGQLTKRDGSFLVGRTDQPNFDYSGLNGKTILMGRRGGVPAMTLQYILNGYGYFDGENITMNYDVQFNMLAPAFTGGTGDYVTLFEPTATAVVNEGEGYIVSSIGAESGEVPYTAYSATKSYIDDNEELLEKFLRCTVKATDYLMENDNGEIAELLLPHFAGTDKQDIINALVSYKANDTWVRTPAMKEEAFNRLQDIMENAGELSERAPFDKVVYNDIALRVNAS